MADKSKQDSKNRKKDLEDFTNTFFDNLISRTISVLRQGPTRNIVRTKKVKNK